MYDNFLRRKAMLLKTLFFALVLLIYPCIVNATTEIVWYGHASFKIKTPQGKVLLIDPWIVNPANNYNKKYLEELDRVDFILLTHAHGDHVGNSIEIAKKTGAKLVASYDLGMAMILHGGFPEKQFGYETTGNIGGEITLLDGEIKISFVPAVHSSALEINNPQKGLVYAGNPGGFIISIKNGPVIYHTGDTDLFKDMKIIGSLYKVDIMMVCIGDKFTMGPKKAAIATKWVNPRIVVPMHYGTFPVLTGKVEDFEKELKSQKVKSKLLKMKIGEIYRF